MWLHFIFSDFLKFVNIRHRILLLAVLFAVLAGCDTAETPTGPSLIPTRDLLQLRSATIHARASGSTFATITKAFETVILLGKAGDQESWALLYFSDIPDSIRDRAVRGARLVLSPSTRYVAEYADTLNPLLAVTAHKVFYAVRFDTVTFDQLGAIGFADANPMGSYALSPAADSGTIRIPISDTSTVRQWISSGGDSLNFGMLLKPAGATNVIQRFTSLAATSSGSVPRLEIFTLNPNSGNEEIVTLTSGLSTYAGSIANTSFTTDSSLVHVRNGISYRGFATFQFPDSLKKSPVHKCILEVTLNANESRLSSAASSYLTSLFVATDGTQSSEIYGSQQEKNSRKIFAFNVTDYIKRWQAGVGNGQIALAGFDEKTSADRYVFYGTSGQPDSLKPTLYITYSASR